MRSRNVLLLAALAALLASAFVTWRAVGEPARTFHYPDAFHYAELGRQVARGEGFSSLQTYPYILAWMQQAGVSLEPPWPNVARFPLISLLYAPAFRFAGASEPAALAVGSLFYVLTAAAALLLGARLFGPGVGIVAAVVCTANASQLAFARSGLLESPAAFFIVASTLALASLQERQDERWSRRRAAVLGLLLGMGFLLRYDLVALSAAAVLTLVIGRGAVGRRQAAWVLLCAALPVGLWMLHNLVAVGSPVVFLGLDRNVLATARFADPYVATSYRSLWQQLASRPEILTAKLPDLLWPLQNWRYLYGWKLQWLGPCFVASSVVLIARRHRALRPLAFVVLAYCLRAMIFTLTHHERRFYLSFTPVLLVLTLGGLWTVLAATLRPLQSRRVELAVAALAAVLYVVTQPVPRGPAGRPLALRPTPFEEVLTELRDRTPAGTTIATLRPEAVAWYGERPAIRADATQLAALEKLGARVDGLLYSNDAGDHVRRALARQDMNRPFVPVYEGRELTLWLRWRLVRGWHDRPREADASAPPAQAG